MTHRAAGWGMSTMLAAVGMAGVVWLGAAEGAPGATNNVLADLRALADPAYGAREASEQRLAAALAAGAEALPPCLAAWAGTPDPEVKTRLESLLQGVFEREVLNRPRGFLGIRMGLVTVATTNSASLTAIRVMGVVEKMPAEKAGIIEGDLILKVDALDLNETPSLQAFLNHVQSHRPGEWIKLWLRRQEQNQTLDVQLGELPPDMKAAAAGDEASRRQKFEQWLREEFEKASRTSP